MTLKMEKLKKKYSHSSCGASVERYHMKGCRNDSVSNESVKALNLRCYLSHSASVELVRPGPARLMIEDEPARTGNANHAPGTSTKSLIPTRAILDANPPWTIW